MESQYWPSQGAHLVRGAHDLLLSEVHSDLTLVTKEGVSIAVHKIILVQCSTLQSILLSSSCCGGRCSSQAPATVLLPDLPYRALKVALDFLYRGRIECSTKEKAGVREVLRVLGVPSGSIEVEERREGHVACTSCPAYLPLEQLAKHMVDMHVLKPAEADVEKVGRGESNSAVRCSYSSSPCNLDTNLRRVNNGFFNYLGLSNPLECVVQHYKEVHLVDMVKHLQKEWDLKIDREQYTRFESQLTKLLERDLVSPMMEVSLEEGRAGSVEEEDIHSGGGMETSDEEEDEEESSSYSGNLDSPDDMDEEKDNVGEDEDDPSSMETIPFDTKDDPTNSSSLPDVVGLTISSTVNLEREDVTEGPLAKKPRKAATPIKCRICDKDFSSEHFKRHVTTHIKNRWKEVSLEEGKRTCDRCKQTLQGREALIVHLATRHNELAAKLEEAGESLSDYELREVTNIEQERILNLTTSTKEDVRRRMELPQDYFSQGLGESPAEGSEREELVDVDDLFPPEEESDGTSGPPPADSDCSADTEPFDPEEEAGQLNRT